MTIVPEEGGAALIKVTVMGTPLSAFSFSQGNDWRMR
jgi:hypothetical protein